MLKRWIADFWNDKRGYVIALTLIAMPLLLGFSLLVIDASRGENLHTDLQDAVDALALAGARQLDGRDDAIARAETAMAQLANSATFGTNGGVQLARRQRHGQLRCGRAELRLRLQRVGEHGACASS